MQITIDIPEEMKFPIKHIADERGFADVSEYVHEVIAQAFILEFDEFGLLDLFAKYHEKHTAECPANDDDNTH